MADDAAVATFRQRYLTVVAPDPSSTEPTAAVAMVDGDDNVSMNDEGAADHGAAADGADPAAAELAADLMTASQVRRAELSRMELYAKLLQYHNHCKAKGITPPAHRLCVNDGRSHLTKAQESNAATRTPTIAFLAAAAEGCNKCLHDALAEGMEVNVRGGGGKTAVDGAERGQHDDTLDFLRAVGGVGGPKPPPRPRSGGSGAAAAAALPPGARLLPGAEAPPPPFGASAHTPMSHVPKKASPDRSGEIYQLCHAAEHGCNTCVDALIQAGLGVNSTTNSGWTVLDWAFFGRQKAMARRLMDMGAGLSGKDPSLEANAGFTVSDIDAERRQ
jgi:hypothetical protein